LSADFQAILLGFFGQEIVAHSATLFAALSGAFIFMSYFRPKKRWHFAWRVSFSVVAALLVTGAIYSGFRIISYGQLANLIYGDPTVDVGKYSSLSNYYTAIIHLASNRTSSGNLFNRIAWIFYFPQNLAWPGVVAIWVVLSAIIYCLVYKADDP
jgi:hypothetical protein